MNKVIKGIKLRLYPNQSQRDQLWQMFGNDRFVWNQMLSMAKERYQNNPSSHFVNEYGMNYLLKQLKREYPFLKESDSTSFLVVNHNLTEAFKRLFKHQGGYPRFKSRHVAYQRARYLPSGGYNYQNSEVYARVKRLLLVRPKLSVIRSVMTRRVVTTSPCKLKQPLNGYRKRGKWSGLT